MLGCMAALTLRGKANFWFVSKYLNGATTPIGRTQIQFRATGLDFDSATMQWQVVKKDHRNAQFKGDGTINGNVAPNDQNYKFVVWAGDSSPDTVRIKIWCEDAAGEHVIYDKGVQQAISGGPMVIHTK
jgi:hypothetical protein